MYQTGSRKGSTVSVFKLCQYLSCIDRPFKTGLQGQGMAQSPDGGVEIAGLPVRQAEMILDQPEISIQPCVEPCEVVRALSFHSGRYEVSCGNTSFTNAAASRSARISPSSILFE